MEDRKGGVVSRARSPLRERVVEFALSFENSRFARRGGRGRGWRCQREIEKEGVKRGREEERKEEREER